MAAYGLPLDDPTTLDFLSEFSTSETKLQMQVNPGLHWKIQVQVLVLLDLGQSSAETIIVCDL